MAEDAQNVKKLRYKTIEIPELTRGIAKDATELIGNTPLVRLNRIPGAATMSASAAPDTRSCRGRHRS